MRVTIEFELRPLEPLSEGEEVPSEPLDDVDLTRNRVESALTNWGSGDGPIGAVEEALFDLFGWTFDSHTVTVTP